MTDQRAHTTRRRETALRVKLTRVRMPATQDWHQSDDSWRGAVRRGTATGLGRRLAKASMATSGRVMQTPLSTLFISLVIFLAKTRSGVCVTRPPMARRAAAGMAGTSRIGRTIMLAAATVT